MYEFIQFFIIKYAQVKVLHQGVKLNQLKKRKSKKINATQPFQILFITFCLWVVFPSFPINHARY